MYDEPIDWLDRFFSVSGTRFQQFHRNSRSVFLPSGEGKISAIERTELTRAGVRAGRRRDDEKLRGETANGKRKGIRKLRKCEMTKSSGMKEGKFRAPRHTDPFWCATWRRGELCASLYIYIYFSFSLSLSPPFSLSRDAVNSMSDLTVAAGSETPVHLSLTRWKSGLPVQVLQFVFGRGTIDCNGLYVRRALSDGTSVGVTWQDLWRRSLYV